MPRALSGSSFIIVCKTPNKNSELDNHSLELCLYNKRALVASLSIQNKVKRTKISNLHRCVFAVVHIHAWGWHSLHTFLLLLFAERKWGHSNKQPTQEIHWDTHLAVSHSLHPPICLSSNLTLRACKIKLQLCMCWHPRCPLLIHSAEQDHK